MASSFISSSSFDSAGNQRKISGGIKDTFKTSQIHIFKESRHIKAINHNNRINNLLSVEKRVPMQLIFRCCPSIKISKFIFPSWFFLNNWYIETWQSITKVFKAIYLNNLRLESQQLICSLSKYFRLERIIRYNGIEKNKWIQTKSFNYLEAVYYSSSKEHRSGIRSSLLQLF